MKGVTTKKVDQSSPRAKDSIRCHPSFHVYAINETDSPTAVWEISNQDKGSLGNVKPGLLQ